MNSNFNLQKMNHTNDFNFDHDENFIFLGSNNDNNHKVKETCFISNDYLSYDTSSKNTNTNEISSEDK